MPHRSDVRIEQVTEKHVGQRLDNFLIRCLGGLPRPRVYRLIRRGEVRVNKRRRKPDYRLELGDKIRIPPLVQAVKAAPGAPSEGLAGLLRAAVLFEDDNLLVLNKPAGLAVHGGSGIRLGVVEAMRQMRPEWAQLELAHRLDRDTSGCLLLVKNMNCLRGIQKSFKDKTVKKHYLALVHGDWPENLRELGLPLRKHRLSSGEALVRVDPEGKPALTRFSVRQRYGGLATLLEVRPVTGRTHQIRVHCAHAGHAIVGDGKYAGDRRGSELGRHKYLCLHASRLVLDAGPGRDKELALEAPLDSTLEELLDKLK